MNQSTRNPSRLLLLLATGLLSLVAVLAAPLGTGFTYQGKLNDNDQPANGTYDFIFALYNSPTNETPIYSGVLNDDVTVTNGIFTALVDFGADLFTGEELWLGVGVRPGNETGDVTLLNPRHRLSAAPYAHFARRAAVADKAATVQEVPWSAVKNLPTAAGPGLAVNGANQFAVSYSGSGFADTAARSDHDHLGHIWTGAPGGAGLEVQNTRTNGIGLMGRNDVGTGFTPASGTGVFGDSNADPGVIGFSRTGSGVYGRSFSATGTHDAVKGENASATGRGVAGYATATTGANIGVLGQTDSYGGTGIRGYATATTGTTYGGRFSNVSPNGYAIHGTSDQAGVAYFDIDNRNNGATALEVRTDGTGSTAKFTSGSSTNKVPAVQAVHLGHGDGLAATAGGRGNAGTFKLLSDYTDNAAVAATGFGKARGLKATSTSGEALRAESNGTAIVAASNEDGTALELDGGAFRVKGAGVNTKTAVFIHKCTSGNTPPSATGNVVTIIDHPMCNGNPNAILLVTPRIKLSMIAGVELPTGATYDDFAIAYSSDRSRWVFVNTSALDEVGDFDEGDTFNVMVVLP